MRQSTEQEWQFATSDLGHARAWLAAQPGETSERQLKQKPTLEILDTYFDSADWMIYRAGFALRMRCERDPEALNGTRTEITLKSLHRAHAGEALARREEISQDVDSTDIAAVIASDAHIG